MAIASSIEPLTINTQPFTIKMNSRLEKLHSYPFAKLRETLEGVEPSSDYSVVSLALGEPAHAPAPFLIDNLANSIKNLNVYPTTKGGQQIREAVVAWLNQRFSLKNCGLDAETNVLPVQGTREALFSIAQAIVDVDNCPQQPAVLLPSPFYQIYEGAAIMAGAEPIYLPCRSTTDFLPDLSGVDTETWQRCQLIYICNPSNPTGALIDESFYVELIKLAKKYDFVVASDECYSEIYLSDDNKPVGLLQVCDKYFNGDLSHCLVFNSLSKRSSLAGLRSGFIAGDAGILEKYFQYRTYQGSAMPLHHQSVSVLAWGDEAHVAENREIYRAKLNGFYGLLAEHFELAKPDGGFCFWLGVDGDDVEFTKKLYREKSVKVLPGQFLAREVSGVNAGRGYVRLAMVSTFVDCQEAVRRIISMVR